MLGVYEFEKKEEANDERNWRLLRTPTGKQEGNKLLIKLINRNAYQCRAVRPKWSCVVGDRVMR